MDTATHTAGKDITKCEVVPAELAQEWLDVGDLARRYKMSSRHIYRLADCGRMPSGIKFGQLRRWSRSTIEAWEAGGCKPVSSAPGGDGHA